jgi:hypothetical protein
MVHSPGASTRSAGPAIRSLCPGGELREAIAARWRINAQTEHASVAAFANLTLALVGVGAPSRLVDAAQRDGQDETRHVWLCFALANAIDGRDCRAPGLSCMPPGLRTASAGVHGFSAAWRSTRSSTARSTRAFRRG